MLKRICFLLLAVTFIFTGMSGCKKNPKGEDSEYLSYWEDVDAPASSESTGSSQAVSAGSESSGNQSTQTSTKKPIVYDLKKATIKAMVREEFKTTSSFKTYMNGFNQAEKAFKCNIEFSYYSDAIGTYNKLTTNYASGKTDYDILMMWGYNVAPRFAASGVLLNMSEYYDYKNDPAWQNDYVKSVGVWKGNRYGLSYGDMMPGYGIWYNKALFSAANVKDPWDYVNANNWNWKTFKEVCRDLTRDTTGDGNPEFWAFNAEDSIASFIVTNGASMIDVSSGNGVFAADSPAAVEAIEYNKMLFTTYKVIPTSTSGLPPQAFYQMQTGKLAMFPYSAAYGAYLVKAGMKASDLGWVYWPKGNAVLNKDYILPTLTEPTCWTIPARVKNPKEITALLTYAIGFWSPSVESPVDITTQLSDVLGDKDYANILVGNNKKLFTEGAKHNVYTRFLNYEGAKPAMLEMLDKILTNKLSTETALKSYKSQIQSLITKDESADALK